jgi:hypothetical protein
VVEVSVAVGREQVRSHGTLTEDLTITEIFICVVCFCLLSSIFPPIVRLNPAGFLNGGPCLELFPASCVIAVWVDPC